MTRQFDGKVAIVTGAAGGIGSAIVEHFAAQGARVGLMDFNEQAGAAYARRLHDRGHEACFAQVDVGSFQSCEAAYAAITEQPGAADIVVNNAGISPKTQGRALNVWEMPPDEWNRVVDVNLNGVFNLTRLATPAEVADARLFFASEQAAFVTGQVLDVAGGWLMTQ